MRSRARSWAWGPAAGVLLVVAVCASGALGLVPGIPILDGLAPPPAYRWIRPPSELRSGNKAPASASATLALTGDGSTSTVVATADDQARLDLPAGAFPPAAGQSAVRVAIDPVDPAQVPPPPPGTAIQGNAYRVAVLYVPGGATTTAAQPVDVRLRYPVDATAVILLTGGAWQSLPTTLESASLAVDATTTRFGIVAAAGAGGGPARPRRTPAWAYAAAGAALLAAAVPSLAARRRPGAQPPKRARR